MLKNSYSNYCERLVSCNLKEHLTFQVFQGSDDSYTTTTTESLPIPQHCRYLRFVPLSWTSSHPGFRVEVYGCDESVWVTYTNKTIPKVKVELASSSKKHYDNIYFIWTVLLPQYVLISDLLLDNMQYTFDNTCSYIHLFHLNGFLSSQIGCFSLALFWQI